MERRSKNTEHAIKIIYRIQGILDYDVFVVHVQNSGLYLWNETTNVKNKIECYDPEDCIIDNIKASPNGQFLAVGFPKMSKVLFFKVYKEECKAQALEQEVDVSKVASPCSIHFLTCVFKD